MNLEKTKKIMLTLLQWIVICVGVGIFSGSASAFFLVALEWVTHFRENNSTIICFLPLGGLFIGLMYHYHGTTVVKGNNLLLEVYQNPQERISYKMAPFILISTLITHLLGGSAGREGTAVQMGGAIADQCNRFFKLQNRDRRILIILGISAGFASIFGTPLAGALFALEIVAFSKINFKSIFLSFFVAYIAYFTVAFWHVAHTHYAIPVVPKMNITIIFWVVIVGILFGLAALLFSRSTHFCSRLFAKSIPYPPLRPFVGGCILVVAIYFIGTNQYIGLGIPSIVAAFSQSSGYYDFVLKILFTSFTLGAGFKGGEVTPLFFVGATLGSALSTVIPLPIALLAGLGFVAVFAGATHTPIACTVMGMELFGIESVIFIGIACCIAYFCSGTNGIYTSQVIKGPKYYFYKNCYKSL